MFYTHELLHSPQYGVATVWLVATIGHRSNGRKLTRKAIQDVNVSKAVEKIIHPGAPIALRLQSNLLFGVSRVYSQQCNYVLSDAEKIQMDMKLFFRQLAPKQTDPKAGTTKRQHIIIENDPAFDPFSQLPSFNFEELEISHMASQSSSQKQYSWLTPNTQNSSNSSGPSILPTFALSQGDRSSLGQNSPFGAISSSAEKPIPNMDPLEPELAPFEGIQLDFGADGELVGILDPDVELPPLPAPVGDDTAARPAGQPNIEEAAILPELDDGPQVILPEEEALPDASALPVNAVPSQQDAQQADIDGATAPAAHRRARSRAVAPRDFVDDPLQVRQRDFRAWNENYLQMNEAAREKKKNGGRLIQSRLNAEIFTYGGGIQGVGNATSIPGVCLPLADIFSGSGLRQLLGLEPMAKLDGNQSHRRKSAEAFGEEEEDRNVRRRIKDDDQQLGRQSGPLDDSPMFESDDLAPEMGREGLPPMDDHRSSSVMPWNKGSSVAHSPAGRSLAGRMGTPSQQHAAESPLAGRGSVVRDIERHSDDHQPGGFLSSDAFDGMPPAYRSSSFDELAAPVEPTESQKVQQTMDAASRDFMAYATALAAEMGMVRDGDSQHNRRWIEFTDIAAPREERRDVAAHAFYHVLLLATRNMLRVKQDRNGNKPFGAIHIGLQVDEEDLDAAEEFEEDVGPGAFEEAIEAMEMQ